ncbi:MAG TPA: hypothetical protein VGF71_04400 [Caulobacteraceae bacterium]|jgi:hypothetical protein
MRHSLLIAVLTLASANATAKTSPETPAAPAPVIILPHAYSGYSEPEIADCQTPTPLMRQCTVPAMTAGRYLIEVVGDASANGAGATQSLQIRLGGAPCATTNPAPFTGKAGLHVGCEVTFLTDKPIVVSAVYAVQNGAPDPKGPRMAFHRLPWNGIVQAQPIAFKARPAPAKTK